MTFFDKIILYFFRKGFFDFLNDEIYLKSMYYLIFHEKLNLKNPSTFNEKLQWLKLYDRKKEYVNLVDKHEVKKIVAEKIGDEYIIPTIGIYDNWDEINFEELPNQFVIKCTHDSGGIEICKDKTNFDFEKAKKKIVRNLKKNFYFLGREWPYKNVKPRIIIEKYMEDSLVKSMRDFKFFCFNGRPEIMYISEGLENHATASMSFFDMDYNQINLKRSDYKLLKDKPVKPLNFEKMKQFSKILSKEIPHVRCDWYEIDGKLYFGELTFSTCSGFMPFEDEKWNEKMGKLLELPNKNDM